MMHATEAVEVHTSNPDQFGQFLLTVYRGPHGVTRTIAWRQDPADTWNPERILFRADVEASIPYVPADGYDERRAAEMTQ